MDIKDLKKIGLTEGEIRIYDALLEFGEMTRTLLAKRSGISPSKIYDVANRLIEKGIVSSVKKNGIIHFSAAHPDRLKDFVAQKEHDIEDEKRIVDSLLPTLIAQYTENEATVDVEVFYGWEGMRTVFDDMTKVLGKDEWDYVFGASKGYDSHHADIFFQQYYVKKRKKGFGTKIIFNESVRNNKVRTGLFLEKPNEMRFLHEETFTEINLYKSTVMIIMMLKKPIIIRLHSKEAADSFKKYFDTLWKLAKE
ncbi:MAG TPA: helix-turn-helix domain-containing protein [Candidatus Nanoarchaeia archaeon]|nr:helix-turn-helix domain-containing protein [Candidatus Nanoarchaeia archaeon]